MITKKLIRLSAGLAFLFSISNLVSSPILAQETATDDGPITIIDRDGKAVDSTRLGKGKEIQATKPGARFPSFLPPRNFGAGAMMGDNKTITIINSDGEPEEIDIRGARSVSISHSSKVVVVDGVKKREMVGKAIIVDADGERHEYDLAPPQAGVDRPMDKLQDNATAPEATKKFTIGINCKTVGALVAAQLQLEPGTGLVVQAVGKDSPAAKAGLKKHDILMFAEDRQLSRIGDLNEVVNKAGNEESDVSLTVIRGGKEIGLVVSVAERPDQISWLRSTSCPRV